MKSCGGYSIKWNWSKFLIDRKGKVVKKYNSGDKPFSFIDDI